MADLRYLTIPKSVSVSVGNVPWSFVHSAIHVIDAHPSFNQTGSGVRAGARIIALIEGKSEGTVVVLDHADWKMLNIAFETPANGYIPPLERTTEDGAKQSLIIPARAFVLYIDAVSDDATRTAPKTEAKPNGAEKALPQAAQVS